MTILHRETNMNPGHVRRCWLIGALCALAPCLTPLAADDPHAAHRAAMQRSPQSAADATVILPDTRLQMRDGRTITLDAARLGQKIVIVDFVYTSCTTICPALTALLASVQKQLQAEGERDWLLLSISVDPARDTPARMDAYAAKVGAGSDWWWLTGDPAQIDKTLRAFGLQPGNPEDHAPVVLVGRPATGPWQRWVGMPAPARIVESVRGLRQRHPPATGSHPHASH